MDMATKIAKKVSEKGGRTFFVGGYVRDELLKIETKSIFYTTFHKKLFTVIIIIN